MGLGYKGGEILSNHECVVCGKSFKPTSCRHFLCSAECREKKRREELYGYEYKRYSHTCEECGKLFTSNHPRRVFCGEGCRKLVDDRKRKRYSHICVQCGVVFIANQPNRKYCSSECRDVACQKKTNKVGNNRTPAREMPTIIPEINIKTLSFQERCINTWHTKGFTTTLKRQVMERDGWQCYICSKETNLHVHHIVPRVEGGEHKAENLVTLCGGCHRSIESGNMENAIIKCVTRAINQAGV